MYLDELIYSFTSKFNYTFDTIGNPVQDGDLIIATNGNMLIAAPKKYFAKDYLEITIKFPDYKRVIVEHDKSKVLFQTDGAVILEECNLLMRKDEYVECEKCEGDGNLYTINHNSFECDECGGNGKAEFLGNLIPTPWSDDDDDKKSFLLNVNGIHFNPNYLESISRVSVALEKPMNWIRSEADSTSIIYIDDIIILVMPVLYGKTSDDFHGDLTIIDIKQIR